MGAAQTVAISRRIASLSGVRDYLSPSAAVLGRVVIALYVERGAGWHPMMRPSRRPVASL